MPAGYRVYDHQIPHFVTSTVVGWIDVFTRNIYKDIVCNSLSYCQQEKGLKLYAWVIMSNHIHLILSAEQDIRIGDLMRDIKKFTSKQIIEAIKSNVQESRKEWMLNQFKYAGNYRRSNDEYQFWQQEFHPVILDSYEKITQRLKYLHENPVRAGMVWEPAQYRYSSAIDYYESKPGLLPITRLEI